MTSPEEESGPDERSAAAAASTQPHVRRRRRPLRQSVGTTACSAPSATVNSSYSGDDSASSSNEDAETSPIKPEQMRRKNKLRRSCRSTGSTNSFISLAAKAVQIEAALKVNNIFKHMEMSHFENLEMNLFFFIGM